MTNANQGIDDLLEKLPASVRSAFSSDLARLQRMALILNPSMEYAGVFWPEFVEHDGCVILSKRFMPGPYYDGWLESRKGDRRVVETELNHLYVLDCFASSNDRPDREVVIWLAHLLRKLWLAKLDHEFPSRRFNVILPDRKADVAHATITFCQAPEEIAPESNV